MTLRRAFALIAFSAFAFLVGGCALRPDRVTVFVERDDAETNAPHRQRTATLKSGVSATYELR